MTTIETNKRDQRTFQAPLPTMRTTIPNRESKDVQEIRLETYAAMLLNGMEGELKEMFPKMMDTNGDHQDRDLTTPTEVAPQALDLGTVVIIGNKSEP